MRTMKIRTFNEGFQVRSHATRQALLVRKWQPLRLGIWYSASVNRSCTPHTTTLPAHVPQPPTASTCTFGASKREWRLSILLPLLYQVMRPRSGPERWQRRPILPSDWTCGAVMAARHAHLDLQYSSDDSLTRISRYFQRTCTSLRAKHSTRRNGRRWVHSESCGRESCGVLSVLEWCTCCLSF